MTSSSDQKPVQQNLEIDASQLQNKNTPMIAQFLEIKTRVPECLLFYRMGDFYELFFNDAIIAAKILDITLTKRGFHKGDPIPMCGVPVHSHESYLHKLIASGKKIAICEQLEDPKEAKKRGPKSIVKRDIVRIVTPGTITEDNLLNARDHNFLTAIVQIRDKIALAWLDISTGEFFTENTPLHDLHNILHRLNPSEILIAEEKKSQFADIINLFENKFTFLPASRFDPKNSAHYLTEFFKQDINAWGDFNDAQITAAGSLLDYVRIMQVNAMPHIRRLQNFKNQHFMQLDKTAHHSLEICQSPHGRHYSLLGKIDKCRSSGGARLLKSWLNAPLFDLETIQNRHQAIDSMQKFIDNFQTYYQEIISFLNEIGDMERALNRLSLNRGNPRDMQIIGHNLAISFQIKALFAHHIHEMPFLIQENFNQIHDLSYLHQKIQTALKNELPVLIRDGGFIAQSFSAQLDHVQQLTHNGKQILLALEQKYRKETGVENLKIKQNNVLGIFIEIPARHSEKLTTDFIHRQSTANTARFTTSELEQSARDIMEARQKSIAIEIELFESLKNDILTYSQEIFNIASALSFFDLTLSHAEFAKLHHYSCPIMSENQNLCITEGRHPIVELSHISGQNNFIANDCHLSDENFLWILTGPNMAGKSTFLRQNALIIIMAQAGLYVPAKNAQIGLVDKLFSRVGAGDDIARGHSTFMVEMLETSMILNNATDKSFVILDEIGRGTATFDGLSLAHAITEYLHDKIQCRTIFATHYHELNQLNNSCKNLCPMHIAVQEYQGDIIFTHQIKQGSAERSYGIHVAKLAGINSDILKRAQMILQQLESEKNLTTENLPLVDWQNQSDSSSQKFKEIETFINSTNPDELSPRDALDCLYHIKMLLSKN